MAGIQFEVTIKQIEAAQPENLSAVCWLNLDEVEATSALREIITEESPVKSGMCSQG